ncbi:nuclear transport factor 2 family protein [Sphaerisporangium fuscum]|uniref:nuclear transport factor 2 family protein n=1 Tax=Sphaerisporangium fuscum TaxID=2835868 RepID=UPI001BDC93A6|nr:nuclear transport factor 2 family protein [Sphaerisporangium fuscum]
MDLERAQRFADEWVDGWNSHDLDRILKHYSDDVVFTSPVAARILDGSDGVVRGKEALRAYWTEALSRIDDLRFEVLGVYAGVDTVVVNYRNQVGQLVNEVLTFDGDLVVAGMGTYGPLPAT